jgi:hypothetical protein
MAAKWAMRTVNAMPNFSPMRLVFNANSLVTALTGWAKVWKESLRAAARTRAMVVKRSAQERAYSFDIDQRKQADEVCAFAQTMHLDNQTRSYLTY